MNEIPILTTPIVEGATVAEYKGLVTVGLRGQVGLRGHAVIVDSAEKPPHSMDVTTGANSTYIKPKLGY